MKYRVLKAKYYLAFLLALASASANAAIDLTPVTTALTTDLTASLVTVGGVLLIAAATAITFKWIKGMLFS